MRVIRSREAVGMQELIKATGFNKSSIRNCLNYLLDNNSISRVEVKKAGPFFIYDYSIRR